MKRETTKSSRRALGSRERLLIIGAAVVGLMGAYALTRVKSKEEELKLFREEISRLQEESKAGRAPRKSTRDLEEAQEALTAAQSALAVTRKALSEETRDQVNAGSSEAVESVMQTLAESATVHGVQVQQAEPHASPIAGMPGIGGVQQAGAATAALPANSPMSGRPMRKLVLLGTYPGLSAFLDDAQRLRQSVRVLSLAMRVTDAKAAATTQSPRLTAELILLL
ncbi:MAG: hypothetical protein ACK4F8_08150 [Aquabacterium sp.]